MSMKRNIVANYLAQFYVTAVNILAVPLYWRHMGAEAYGLISFFSLMQIWSQLLDMGLSPTLARVMARYRGGALGAVELRKILRAMELVFFSTSAFGAILCIALSSLLARRWLRVEELPLEQVASVVRIMGCILGMRLISSMYRSAIGGLEEQVWLSGFNIAFATLRSVLVLPLIAWVDSSVWMFFGFQFLVALLEVLVLGNKVHQLIPDTGTGLGFSLRPLQPLLKFSGSITFAALVWLLVTQTDKLVLSKVLTLSAFGTFSLGVLVAGAVNLASTPISQAVLPGLTRLAAANDTAGTITLYRRTTQWVSAVAAPAALTLALFAESVLYAWTGDRNIATQAARVLILYALGNGMLSVAAFQYYLQYANGNLRLHMIGNVSFVVILVPLLIWAATVYGVVGAGVVWVSQCAVYLLIWTWVVHRRFAPGVHSDWLLRDVIPVWLSVAAVGGGLWWVGRDWLDTSKSRLAVTLGVVAYGCLLAIIGVLATRDGFHLALKVARTRDRSRT